jgi:hypothetical protein
MALGCVVLVGQGQEEQAVQPFLGAPLAIRALASALIPGEDVVAVAVAPSAAHDALRHHAERFGLTELVHLLEPSQPARAIDEAVELLTGDGVDAVVWVHGLMPLAPTATITELVVAAREHGAATLARSVDGALFLEEPRLQRLAPGPVCVACLPAAFRMDVLARLLEVGGEDLFSRSAAAGIALERVLADKDAFPLLDEADLNRALEAWGRRAPEYAFIWPRSTEEVTPDSPAAPPAGAEVNFTIPDRPVPEGEGS